MSTRLKIIWGISLFIVAVVSCSIGYNIGVGHERAQRNAYYNEQVTRIVEATENRLVASGVQAAAPQKTSRTFEDILKRVSSRDRRSDAILLVRMKDDAPRDTDRRLRFHMEERDERSVLVRLYTLPKMPQVYEQYVLAIDENIKKELENRRVYAENLEKDSQERLCRRKERIEKLSQAKLKLGMTEREVIAVLGRPKNRKLVFPQKAPRDQRNLFFQLIYDDITVEFSCGKLADVTPK